MVHVLSIGATALVPGGRNARCRRQEPTCIAIFRCKDIHTDSELELQHLGSAPLKPCSIVPEGGPGVGTGI